MEKTYGNTVQQGDVELPLGERRAAVHREVARRIGENVAPKEVVLGRTQEQEGIMKLTDGGRAPEFSARDIFGNQIDLRAYAGKRLLLSFFRFAKCPFCNLRVSRMLSRFQTYQQAGLEMIAVFESPAESMFDGVAKQQPPFPLIADPDNELYRPYGLQISKFHMLEGFVNPIKTAKIARDSAVAIFGKGFWPTKIDGPIARMPADFLIGPDLTIERAYYGTYVSDHLPFEDVERIIGLTAGVVHDASAASLVDAS